jgi:hypothetical protein
MNKQISKFFGAMVLSLVGTACLASGYQTWTEQFTCGKATYKIQSVCKASSDTETLNDCKSQHLEITQGNETRKTKLPELNRSVAGIIKEAGGQLKDLFVVKQGCANISGSPVEILYYSIGGGSAPYAEAYAEYDLSGNLLGEKDLRSKKAAEYPFERLKGVRSIMPDEH